MGVLILMLDTSDEIEIDGAEDEAAEEIDDTDESEADDREDSLEATEDGAGGDGKALVSIRRVLGRATDAVGGVIIVWRVVPFATSPGICCGEAIGNEFWSQRQEHWHSPFGRSMPEPVAIAPGLPGTCGLGAVDGAGCPAAG
jgi:hypothetical protein